MAMVLSGMEVKRQSKFLETRKGTRAWPQPLLTPFHQLLKTCSLLLPCSARPPVRP